MYSLNFRDKFESKVRLISGQGCIEAFLLDALKIQRIKLSQQEK